MLQQAERALPAGGDDRAREGIRAFLTRIPAPGPEFRCSADFVRWRARQALRRLRDVLRNDAPAPLAPAICYVAPFALDAERARSEGSLDIYGIDFDTQPLQVVLVDDQGYQDVTSALVVRSHHHLVLRVGRGGVRVTSKSQSLGLAWGHLIHHSIAIVQPEARLCGSRIETTPAGAEVSHLAARASAAPSDPSEGTPWADAELEYATNALEATVCLTAPDPVLSGCTVGFLYTTDPDRVIDGVIGLSSSRASPARGGAATPARDPEWPEPVARWSFSGFQPGELDGRHVSVTAHFNGIRVVSSEGEGCVSPIAYLEAARTGALGAEARGALDAQLAGIDPAIASLRPRFAPPLGERPDPRAEPQR